jgi:hypothetical protein
VAISAADLDAIAAAITAHIRQDEIRDGDTGG